MFKKIILSAVLLIFIVGLCSCTNTSANNTELNPANQDALDISIINLIATPEKYHGKVVRVIGVGNLEFEGDAIYLSRDDYKYVSNNGLWIELGEKATSYDEAKKLNGKYVIVEGTFDKNDTGHMGMWSGSIKKISRYELWER